MRIKTSKRIVAYIGLIIFSLFAVIPVVYVFLLSLQTDAEAASLPPTIIPEVPRIENFSIVTERIPIGRYTLNSLIFAVGTTIVVIITSLFAGYASTKLQMPGRRFLVSIFLGSVLIPPATRMIPLYTLIARLDLVDTWAGLSLPYMATAFGCRGGTNRRVLGKSNRNADCRSSGGSRVSHPADLQLSLPLE